MSQELLDPFEYRKHRTENEQKFFDALFKHSEEWFQVGVTKDDCYLIYEDSIMTIAFDICDLENPIVLRCLRIDLGENNLLLGYDESMQYICHLNSEDSNAKQYSLAEYSIKNLAEIAAKWLNFEFSRKIVFRQWRIGSILHEHYFIEDIEKQLNWSDSENKQRFGLGTPTFTKVVFPKKH